jgi:hypothetical protein
MPVSAVKELTPDVVMESYREYKLQQGGGRSGAASSNWPTTLSHECPAYAFYNRTVPADRRRPISAELKMIFSEGHDQARIVQRDLIDAGFIISDQEGQMQWPQYQISGRRDLKIWKEGFRERINVEVKSCSRYTFDAINKPDDLSQTGKDWLKKWFKQIALYMVLQGVETYWLLLKSKEKGQIKIIPFTMNDEILNTANEMISRAEWVNNLIQIGKMPQAKDKISDADVCSECEFFDACLPDLAFGPGAIVFDDEAIHELTLQLNRREELQPAAKEFKQLDEDLKQEMKMHASEGQTKIVIGEWIVTLKDRHRNAYSVGDCDYKEVKFLKV